MTPEIVGALSQLLCSQVRTLKLLAGVLEVLGKPEAARLANEAAGIVVAKFGTATALAAELLGVIDP